MALTLTERLTLLPILVYILGKGIFCAVLGPFRLGRWRLRSYGTYLPHRIANGMFTWLSARQLQ
jgi:hypothetical protein